jgi:hypothetical protein
VVATASSGVACAVMLLWVSIVKVVILFFLCSAGCAVNTWITPQGWKRKGSSEKKDGGGPTAMVTRAQRVAPSEPRGSTCAPGNRSGTGTLP